MKKKKKKAGVEVQVGRGVSIDKALRLLKKALASEGTLRELKENRYYQKPGDKRRKKQAAARKRKRLDDKMNEKKGIM